MRIVVPSGASTTFGISSISESKSATDSGTTRSGGITKGGGVGASISTWAPLPIFNPFMEFFHELRWNHQGVRTKKLWSLQDFQHKPHESLQEAYG